MSYFQRTEIKMNQFREDIKNENIFEKKLIYLLKIEFDAVLNNILLLEPNSFIDRIEKGIFFFYENLYSEKCLSEQKLISTIEKNIELKKIEYSNIATLLRNAWNIYERINKRQLTKDDILTKFRKHCVNTPDIAKHNCGSVSADFILVKDKEGKINFVICESCKKVYYSSYICCLCSYCNIEYYTNILNEGEDSNFFEATWEKYHCPQILNEKMKCIQCKEPFYINMKTGMLTCLNKRCNFISEPNKIIWSCNVCQKDFNSNAIPYNPLEIKMVKNAIRQTLLLKHRAHPNNLPCCKLNVFFIEFFHKKICRGLLYEGELNNKMIIVCDKCHAINYYERFIWTCPKCLRKFKDINNENNIENNNKRKNDYREIIRKKSKCNSIEKDYLINNYKKDNFPVNDGTNIIEPKILENKNIKDNKNQIQSNILHFGIDLEPKKSGLVERNDKKNSPSQLINSNIKQEKNGFINITINNESGKKINNFIINNNNISIFYSKYNNEKNNNPNKLLKHLSGEQLIKKVSCGEKSEKKEEEKNDRKNHHKVFVSVYKRRSASSLMNSGIEKNYLKNPNNENVKNQEIKNNNINHNKKNDLIKKRNFSIENIYHGKNSPLKKNRSNMIKVEYNQQKRKKRYSSVENSIDYKSKNIENVIQNDENNNSCIHSKIEKKSINVEKENSLINFRKNRIRFHANINSSYMKSQNENINTKLKKIINMKYYQRKSDRKKLSEISMLEKNIKEKNENKINNNEDKIIKEYENKNQSINNNNNFKEIIVKKSKNEENGHLVNKIDNNKNNNNDKNNFPFIPSNIGIENLGSISENLLQHLKLRINNIFSKSKLPIFDIEDYTINQQLGEGTYGTIYSVYNKKEKGKEFALKKIIAKSVSEIMSFIKEFELVYSCDHPNIMKIYGFCLRILDNTTFAIYVLMEKSKYDWDKEIKIHLSNRRYYTEKELINILKQLCEALLFLKTKLNISHRDIKPQNVLVFNGDVYKLADFGEAKEIKISKKLNTLRGTELYMSPILYEGLKHDKSNVSHDSFKSDVFSLGFCFLYAAGLNFNLLYQARDITNNDTLNNIINDHLSKLYSKNFVLLVSLMLKIDESKRIDFKDILEFIDKNYQ